MTASPYDPAPINPTRALPVLARHQPFPNELFRSLLARTARSSSTPYREFIAQLGLASKGRTSAWVGVELPNSQADTLAVLLRHTPETLQEMQLPFDRASDSQEWYHPTRYRACAECQVEHGAWMRWSADALYVVCPIHKTLLWSEFPEHKRLQQDAIFQTNPEEIWGPFVAEPCDKTLELAELQERLGKRRFFAGHNIEVRFAEMVVGYRRAVSQSPKHPTLAKFAGDGWAVLEAHDRRVTDVEQQDRVASGESIWTRVEDAIAIYPTAVRLIIEAHINGDSEAYESMRRSIFELGEDKRIQTNSAARFHSAVFVEDHLDSGDARRTSEEWAERLLAGQKIH